MAPAAAKASANFSGLFHREVHVQCGRGEALPHPAAHVRAPIVRFRDEPAVHDIQMQVIASGLDRLAAVLSILPEVGGEDGGPDERRSGRVLEFS